MAVVKAEGGTEKKKTPKEGQDTKLLGANAASKTNAGYGPGPVTVYVSPDVYKPAVVSGIKLWNKQVGFKVFSLVSKASEADVLISLGPTVANQNAAAVGVPGSWTKSGQGHVILDKDSFSKEAATSPALYDQAAYAASLGDTVQHELGHAIALGHPGNPANPYVFKGGPDSGIGTVRSGIMGSADQALDKGGVPIGAGFDGIDSNKPGLSTPNERDMVASLRQMGEAAFYSQYQGVKNQARNVEAARGTLSPEEDTAGLTDEQWSQIAEQAPGGFTPPPPPSGGGSSSGGSSSGGSSSSSSSSGPTTDTYGDVFKQDAVARQKWSMFSSAYAQLWGEPATEQYLIDAVNQGWNTQEFIHHERMKTAFQNSETYKQEAKGLFGLLRQLGI